MIDGKLGVMSHVFRDGLSVSNYNHTALRIPKEVNAKAVPLLAVRAFLEMRF